MKNALSEIKKLGKAKPKKPKQVDVTEYSSRVTLYCHSIIRHEDNFKLFCTEEQISPEIARKMQEFADTESFSSYITNPVFAVITNPEHKLVLPTKENIEVRSEHFAVVILKYLAEDLETQSVESVAAKAEKTMQAFIDMAKPHMTPELIEKFGDIPI